VQERERGHERGRVRARAHRKVRVSVSCSFLKCGAVADGNARDA